jgi:hypothetical protein
LSALPRWRIQDLIARYTLEPSLRDVFVEGQFDKDLLCEHFRKLAVVPPRYFYEIDVVEIPEELLTAHSLTAGNKNCVLALARELAAVNGTPAYRCLVDRDLDQWFGELERTSRLVWTRYCTIELHLFSEAFVHDILVVAARSRISNWQTFFASFVSVLRELYVMRLVGRELKLPLRWISPDRCSRVESERIVFDRAEYIRRVLIAQGFADAQAAFDAAFLEWWPMCSGDPREHVRGGDLVEMLAWAVRQYGGLRSVASEETIRRMFVLRAADASDLVTVFE